MPEKYFIRGHHLEILRKYVYEAGSQMINAIFALQKTYGEFAPVAASKIDLMISSPDNQITIINNLDDVCNANCPYRLKDSCQRNDIIVSDSKAAEFDDEWIKHFKLEKDKTYSASELIEKLNI